MSDQVEIKMPPSYADIFNNSSGESKYFETFIICNLKIVSGDVSSLGTPPAYYSATPSESEDNILANEDKSE